MATSMLDYLFMRVITAPYCSYLYVKLRCKAFFWNRRSKASDPGRVRLSHDKLGTFCPQWYPYGQGILDWWDRIMGIRAIYIFGVSNHLWNGDSRAAVVISVSPLLVAAYTDEMDCIAVLRFPDEFVSEFGLEVRSRLLTVNTYYAVEPLAPDLTEGPLSFHRYGNFIPRIADFLTDDVERLRARKAKIIADEWARAWVLGMRYLETHGPVARDGHPERCFEPAGVGSLRLGKSHDVDLDTDEPCLGEGS
jgi:hypothetical protein